MKILRSATKWLQSRRPKALVLDVMIAVLLAVLAAWLSLSPAGDKQVKHGGYVKANTNSQSETGGNLVAFVHNAKSGKLVHRTSGTSSNGSNGGTGDNGGNSGNGGNGGNSGQTPAISLPSITTPAITVPGVTLPGITTPSVMVPSISTPSVSVSTGTTVGVSTPVLSATLSLGL